MLTDGITFVFTVTVKEQFVAGEFVSAYITVVIPALNVNPLTLPFPFPVVAPVSVYVNEEPCGETTGSILFTTAVHRPAAALTATFEGQVIDEFGLTIFAQDVVVPGVTPVSS